MNQCSIHNNAFDSLVLVFVLDRVMMTGNDPHNVSTPQERKRETGDEHTILCRGVYDYVAFDH
jgi:hypothetical protein